MGGWWNFYMYTNQMCTTRSAGSVEVSNLDQSFNAERFRHHSDVVAYNRTSTQYCTWNYDKFLPRCDEKIKILTRPSIQGSSVPASSLTYRQIKAQWNAVAYKAWTVWWIIMKHQYHATTNPHPPKNPGFILTQIFILRTQSCTICASSSAPTQGW